MLATALLRASGRRAGAADNFNRADGAPGNTPTGGYLWTVVGGATIESNRLRLPAGARATLNLQVADVELGANLTPGAALLFRGDEVAGKYWRAALATYTESYQVYEPDVYETQYQWQWQTNVTRYEWEGTYGGIVTATNSHHPNGSYYHTPTVYGGYWAISGDPTPPSVTSSLHTHHTDLGRTSHTIPKMSSRRTDRTQVSTTTHYGWGTFSTPPAGATSGATKTGNTQRVLIRAGGWRTRYYTAYRVNLFDPGDTLVENISGVSGPGLVKVVTRGSRIVVSAPGVQAVSLTSTLQQSLTNHGLGGVGGTSYADDFQLSPAA